MKKIRAYSSSDYAGLDTSKYNFYYVYERTICKKHRNHQEICDEQECDLAEWAFFVTDKKDVDLFIVSESALKKACGFEIDTPEQGLLVGIGMFINQQL